VGGAVPTSLWAQGSDYPNKSITFLVPQAAGGSTDALAREIGLRLASALGQSIVVDNRAGANGLIGCELVAKSKPDGYMLLVGGTGTMSINQHLYKNMPYDPVKSFVPVALFGYSTSVLVVHPSVQAKTIGELIADIKAKPPETYKYASAGVGSSPHLTAEMFKQMTGTAVLHIPYKGSTPGVIGTMSGETQMMFTGVSSAVAHIKSGRLKALSISGPKRSPALPNVPTAGESGLPGFEADFWIGLFAPAGTPPAVVARLNSEVNRVLTSQQVKEKFLTTGVDSMVISPEAFGAIMAKDTERWGKTVQLSGMKVE
jgi:tripartite-type tricarboxylate transporter receptor subunit TctC